MKKLKDKLKIIAKVPTTIVKRAFVHDDIKAMRNEAAKVRKARPDLVKKK